MNILKKKYINDLFYNPGGITDDIRNVSKYFKNKQNYKFDILKNPSNYYNNKFKNLNEGKYEDMFSYINKTKDLISTIIII